MPSKRTIRAIIAQVLKRKYAFFGAFFAAMVVSYGILYAIDFIPEPIEEGTEQESGVDDDRYTANSVQNVAESDETEDLQDRAALPLSIHIDALGRTVSVQNPTSRSIEDLDAALLSGVVRHPDSADFRDRGNIFILGHSSYLPNVFNKNFQAFNGIQDLKWGDTIRLRSEDTEYIYRVERVYEAKASEVTVPNSRGTAKLTLATCNTFGAKEDRHIVEAGLVSTRSL